MILESPPPHEVQEESICSHRHVYDVVTYALSYNTKFDVPATFFLYSQATLKARKAYILYEHTYVQILSGTCRVPSRVLNSGQLRNSG